VKFNLDTPKDLLDLYLGLNMEEIARLCEFYLHNLISQHPYNCNPNTYVGDVQLMPFASSIRNEEMREKEIKKYEEEELQTPFWIRDEETRPRDVITNHHHLSLGKYVAP
jgi:hypothetical protein